MHHQLHRSLVSTVGCNHHGWTIGASGLSFSARSPSSANMRLGQVTPFTKTTEALPGGAFSTRRDVDGKIMWVLPWFTMVYRMV